jgi:hypothetical protein
MPDPRTRTYRPGKNPGANPAVDICPPVIYGILMNTFKAFLIASSTVAIMATAPMADPSIANLVKTQAAHFQLESMPHVVVDDSQLDRRQMAKFNIYSDGATELIFNTRMKQTVKIAVVVDHELSHLAAYEKYGFDIREHGKEFMAECRAYATYPSQSCKVGTH